MTQIFRDFGEIGEKATNNSMIAAFSMIRREIKDIGCLLSLKLKRF